MNEALCLPKQEESHIDISILSFKAITSLELQVTRDIKPPTG